MRDPTWGEADQHIHTFLLSSLVLATGSGGHLGGEAQAAVGGSSTVTPWRHRAQEGRKFALTPVRKFFFTFETLSQPVHLTRSLNLEEGEYMFFSALKRCEDLKTVENDR